MFYGVEIIAEALMNTKGVHDPAPLFMLILFTFVFALGLGVVKMVETMCANTRSPPKPAVARPFTIPLMFMETTT